MIYITGDTHGSTASGYNSVNGYLHRLSTKVFPEQKEMTKNDFVIICGDFGGVWSIGSETKEEIYGLNWLENKPFTTLFVPGNHENYDRLIGIQDKELLDSWFFDRIENLREFGTEGYPQADWHGGKVRKIRDSVLMLERGYVFDIDGKKIFAFGGARSHDVNGGILNPLEYDNNDSFSDAYKEYYSRELSFRVKHSSWWEEEMPSEREMNIGLMNLEINNNEVDYIVTHDCALSTLRMFSDGMFTPDELNRYLQTVKEKTKYKKWFFGHYHDNRAVTSDEIMLYEQIIRIS